MAISLPFNYLCTSTVLHYTTHIQSRNASWVCFIHGAGGSSNIWFRQIREFSRHFNVLLIDLRGHGNSKKPVFEKLKTYTFKHIGNDVMEVLDHLQIRSAHFVGISLGTIIIREISERFPGRTESMILGGAVMKLNMRGQILMHAGALLKSVLPYLVLYRFFAFTIMPRRNHRESRNFFIQEAKKLYQKEFKRWFTLVSEVNPLLSLFRIKDSGIPTLYIMGEEDHMFLPSIKKLVSRHLSSELIVIPQCGHVVNIEQPMVFNELAISFARRLDARTATITD